jgi:hypothetical protein
MLYFEGKGLPQHVKEAHPNSPDVDSLIPISATIKKFWSAKGVRATVCQHATLPETFRTVEVTKLDVFAIIANQDVLRLQVSVHNTLAMKIVHGLEDLLEEWSTSSLFECAMTIHILLHRTLEQLHADPNVAWILKDVGDIHNRWMF